MLLAVLAAVLLLLLPGGLMLLAPWSIRPFLSAAFWITSWWWLPRLGPGRASFLQGALVAFGLLGLTRFLKPIELARPSRARALVGAGMALLLLWPSLTRWPVPPETAFEALTARLLLDRDGVPGTYEPLLPIHAFGLRPSGFSGWAADVGLLSGSGPLEATLVAAGMTQALLLLAMFHVLRRVAGERPAALGSVCLAAGVAVFAGVPCRTVLGVALALAAGPHLTSRNKAPAVAAGVLLGASLLSGGIVSPVVVLVLVIAVGAGRALRSSGGGRRRLALASAVGVLVSVPTLVRVSPAGLLDPPIWSGLRFPERLPSADDRAAMAWLKSESAPLTVVCAEGAPAAAWIPAVSGRAVVLDGRIGPLPRGAEPPPQARSCRLSYVQGAAPRADAVRFRSGVVTIVENSNSLR